jgi:long-subunit fatty acid transport protein
MPARSAVIVVTVAVVALGGIAPSAAQSLDLAGGVGGGAGIGRAGAALVGGDDGTAVWQNPAGLARRGGTRLQLGLAAHDVHASFTTAENFGPPAAVAHEQGAPVRVPWLGVQHGLGERVVVGLSWIEPTALSIAWPAPPADVDEMEDDRARYPGRYAGTATRIARRGVSVGASLRALPWLAVGVSVYALRVELTQTRTVFGGLGADSLPNLSPSLDLTLSLDGRDDFQPGGTVGILVAPVEVPLELAASLSYTSEAELDGTPQLTDSRGRTPAAGNPPNVAAVVAPSARARLTLPGGLRARAGVRFLAPRFTVEADGELATGGDAEPVWQVEGVSLAFNAGPQATLDQAPLGVKLRSSSALRLAVDVDVVPGFLTLTAGWAYARSPLRRTSISPALPLPNSHTLAGGASLTSGGVTVSLGLAHTMGAASFVAPGDARVLAPLAGDADLAAAAGQHDASTTLVGAGIEVEW